MSEVRSADRVEWITRMLRAAALVFVAPLAASADVTFVHWSDTHVTGPTPPGYKLKIVEDMNTIPEKSWPEKAGGGKVGPVDFALCTGDLTDSGKPEEWEGYLALRAKIAFPSYDAMGNHDFRQGRSVENGIRKLHGETYYSFDKGGVHVVVMNEYTARHRLPDFNAAQLDWLAKDLAKVEKGVTPVVLAMHSPPLRGKDHFMSLGESINRFADILKGHKAVIVSNIDKILSLVSRYAQINYRTVEDIMTNGKDLIKRVMFADNFDQIASLEPFFKSKINLPTYQLFLEYEKRRG